MRPCFKTPSSDLRCDAGLNLSEEISGFHKRLKASSGGGRDAFFLGPGPESKSIAGLAASEVKLALRNFRPLASRDWPVDRRDMNEDRCDLGRQCPRRRRKGSSGSHRARVRSSRSPCLRVAGRVPRPVHRTISIQQQSDPPPHDRQPPLMQSHTIVPPPTDLILRSSVNSRLTIRAVSPE
jgi:hypothetical protein